MKNKFKKGMSLLMVSSILISCIPYEALAMTKDEIVYIKLKENGEVKSTIVNEHLINNNKENELSDYSELKDILNINGQETYTIDNNNITWSSSGNDIFYQGKLEKNLPIEANITYKLNGEVKELKDILGKSGRVSIIIKYKNLDSHNVLVNGHYETLYTPFVVTMGTIIPSATSKNISITNGKVISSGTKNIIVGLSTPGLYESLNMEELHNLDTITLEYDTESFELGSIYTVATPKIIDKNDLDLFNKMDSIYSKVNTLQDNMNLIDESGQKLKNGSNELMQGLEAKLKELSQSNEGKVLPDEQLNIIKNQAIASVKATFTDEYKQEIANNAWLTVSSNMNPDDEAVKNIVTNSVTNAVVEYLNSVGEYNDYTNCETGKYIKSQGGNMTEEQLASCQVISEDTTLPYVKQASITSSSDTASKVSTYVAENVSKQVAVKVAEDSALNTAITLAPTLSEEVAKSVLKESTKVVTSSLNELNESIKLLNSGITELSEGITKFNDEGIKNVSSLVNNNLRTKTEELKALTKLGQDYKPIGGSKLEDSGDSKFIMVVDGQKVKTEKNTTTTSTEKTSFWTRLKNLFK